jgi:hypothetical protein
VEQVTEIVIATQTEASEIPELSRADCYQVTPSDTNAALKAWDEPHFICPPAEATQQQGRLFVFLPGTGATPADYTFLLFEAAQAGFHSLGLRYPNDESVNLSLCPRVNDSNCHENVRAETLYGRDMSTLVSVDPANSIGQRLQSALVYMRDHYPDEGWGQYLSADEEIIWSSLIVAGHSQGGGHAIFMAREYPLDRVIAFAWVDVRDRELAPWLTETTFQTPSEDTLLFWHQDDSLIARHQPALMNALGLEAFGEPVWVEDGSPPYGGSHALIATAEPPVGQRAHNTIAVDWALNFDPDDQPIYREVWRYLLTDEVEDNSGGQISQMELHQGVASRMGDSEYSYIDPEFLNQENLIAFADEQRNIWLGALDPLTGLFIKPDGRETLIDTAVTPLVISFNGPEFGMDSEGWSMYYTKDQGGVPQIWQASVVEEGVIVEPISTDSTTRLSVLASADPSSETIRLLYAWNGFSIEEGRIAWLDVSQSIGFETIVDTIDRGVRWIDGTTMFTYISFDDTEQRQLLLYDTSSGEVSLITQMSGQMSYAYGWIAPEYGDLLILTVIDNTRIEIFHDEGDPMWERIASLEIPAESEYTFIGSPEAFAAGGSSFISLVVKQSQGYAPGEVWVWGIGQDEDGIRLRCEDALGAVIRSDPESYIGVDEVYIYYNVIRLNESGQQTFELYKCDTGIIP